MAYSGKPIIFPLTVNGGRPIAAKSQRTAFQREIRENFEPWLEWAFRHQLFVADAPWIFISHFFCLMTLKPVLAI
jgi:hypothetical protein